MNINKKLIGFVGKDTIKIIGENILQTSLFLSKVSRCSKKIEISLNTTIFLIFYRNSFLQSLINRWRNNIFLRLLYLQKNTKECQQFISFKRPFARKVELSKLFWIWARIKLWLPKRKENRLETNGLMRKIFSTSST